MMKRKKIFAFILLFGLFLLSCASNQVLSGTEKIVELYVPGCGGWGGNSYRVSSILRGVEGVLNVKIVDISVTVTFAPEKTNVEKLIKALKTEGFDVTGTPKFLK